MTATDRAYYVTNEKTGASERFTNKAKARKAYRSAQKAGEYVSAATFLEREGHRTRLDNGIPEWTL